MSDHEAVYSYQEEPTNSMAIAGFACSLLGLITGGHLLTPIGLILSIVALGRPGNRALAWWGVALGVLGLCGWGIALLVAGAAILTCIAGAVGISLAAIALSEPEKVEITTDMVTMAVAIEQYREENDFLPASLTGLGLRQSTLLDPWGKEYEYRLVSTEEFDLASAGEDGQFHTEDDILLSELGDAWEGSGFDINVEGDDETGRVTIDLGGRRIDVGGRDEEGRVTIDTGNRIIEIIGDEEGGRIESHDAEEGGDETIEGDESDQDHQGEGDGANDGSDGGS